MKQRALITLSFLLVVPLNSGCYQNSSDITLEQKHAPLIAFTGTQRGRLAEGEDEAEEFSFDKAPPIKDILNGEYQPPSPQELGDGLQGASSRWFYGPGFGRTLTNVATAVIFPPYAIYLLGNAGLAIAGYQPLHVTDALPNPAKEHIVSAYDGVTSVPGRVTSFVAGREYYELENSTVVAETAELENVGPNVAQAEIE